LKGKQYHPQSEISWGHACPRVVIAGLKGGSGKTLLALGIIKAWRDKGLNIVPFKKGPDYIDAGWLAYAAGQPCYNLDPFLTGKEKVLSSFLEHTIDANGAVIEGNRGIYDGMDVDGTYSTAELSKIIKSPVVLILDCTKTTRTVAAMILGCMKFDPEVAMRGVILNQIANSRHESIIRTSIERYSNLPVLGAIPRLREGLFGERHMGLIPYQEHLEPGDTLDTLRSLAERYIDLDGIWKVANEAEPIEVSSEIENPPLPPFTKGGMGGLIKIGVIKDSAFQFYYPENFAELIARGATLIEINALKDMELPEIDALYIGGGFPETHALALAENTAFRSSLCEAIEEGLPVYAECGGLMYLGEAILIEGKTYPMSGVFPILFSLERIPQAHGYTIVEVERPNPYFPVGCTLNGHEFHYSKVIDPESPESSLPPNLIRGKGSRSVSQLFGRDDIYFAFKMKRGQGLINKMDALCYKNVLATYTHLHALGTSEWVDGIIRQAISYRGKRLLN
jgi:cobyrinic acid a,c-diamide synthase